MIIEMGIIAIQSGVIWHLWRKTRRCPYTKLLNKQQFEADLKRLRGEYVIILDIDKFKQINDNLGHLAGDKIIVQVSDVIKDNIRLADRAYRIGGDEFAIITAHKDVAERVKRACEVSISIGIGKTYRLADEDMYLNKTLQKFNN